MDLQKCRSCGNEYPQESFPTAGIVKGKFYRRRKCQNCYWQVKKKRRDKLRSWLQEHKKTLKCAQCGEDDFRVLDFHHKEKDKEFCLSDGPRYGYGAERLQQEIDKCQCLCCKCHRILHYEENHGDGSAGKALGLGPRKTEFDSPIPDFVRSRLHGLSSRPVVR